VRNFPKGEPKGVHIHVYVHVYTYTCIFVNINLYTYMYVYTYIYIWIYMSSQRKPQLEISPKANLKMYIYTHIIWKHDYMLMYICTHIYIYVNRHICMSIYVITEEATVGNLSKGVPKSMYVYTYIYIYEYIYIHI
jgi:hypothetical protein